ncbi:MAG: flagellar biosynthesis anti-sigma factor FlgM [Dehalococcoidia bacterium]|nr:flagellar biosynthesis anti-sigma factor FlgM [Dehalococcoidia bacterium]
MPRIDGHNPLQTSRLGQGQQVDSASQGQSRAKDANGVGNGADQASISNRGRVIADAISNVQRSPDVRQEKVAALKASIANGTYHSNARDVAARLLAGGSLGED